MERKMTRAELEDRIAALEEENENLQDKLDSITEIVGEEGAEEDDDD